MEEHQGASITLTDPMIGNVRCNSCGEGGLAFLQSGVEFWASDCSFTIPCPFCAKDIFLILDKESSWWSFISKGGRWYGGS